MVKREEIITLLKEKHLMSTQEIYNSIKDTYPLSALVDKGFICCLRTDKNYYFLPENISGIPWDLKDYIIDTSRQEKPINKPKQRTWKKVFQELELNSKEIKQLKKAIHGQGIMEHDPNDRELMVKQGYYDLFQKGKYWNDPEYRERKKVYSREYQRKKRIKYLSNRG